MNRRYVHRSTAHLFGIVTLFDPKAQYKPNQECNRQTFADWATESYIYQKHLESHHQTRTLGCERTIILQHIR